MRTNSPAWKQELAKNPQLRLELERLRRCLEPLESVPEAADVDPPAGLADRVCDAIEAHAARVPSDATQSVVSALGRRHSVAALFRIGQHCPVAGRVGRLHA